MKKTLKKTASPMLPKLVFLVLVVLLGLWYFSPNKGMNYSKKSNQITAQLSPKSNGLGMGSAVKSFEKSTYTLDVSVIMSAPAKGKEYFVWLTEGGSKSAEIMLAGQMTASGDVYSLNFTSDKNLDYKKVVVTLQTESEAKSGNLTGEVLSGEFSK